MYFQMATSGIDQLAFTVLCDYEVMVYGVNMDSYSSDAFLAIPTDVIGTDYYAVVWYPPSSRTQIGIVGTVDGTTVSLTFPSHQTGTVSYGSSDYSAGDTLTITLNR